MNVERIIDRLPILAAVVGEKWLCQKREWAESFITQRLSWYDRLEIDLHILTSYLDIKRLTSCYRKSLRDPRQIQKIIFEIHGAALLASIATQIFLHVPRKDGSNKNFDVWAEIQGCYISAESKTRKDEFPFKLSPEMDNTSGGIPVYGGTRATMDIHHAVDLGIEVKQPDIGSQYIAMPESTVIQQGLLEGLGQLPSSGYNLIIFGHIEGDRYHLENALFGTDYIEQRINRNTKGVAFAKKRASTGAFNAGPSGEAFKSLNGVIWIRLWRDGNTLGRAYKLYVNPYSIPLPDDVIEALNAVMKQWATWTENHQRVTEDVT